MCSRRIPFTGRVLPTHSHTHKCAILFSTSTKNTHSHTYKHMLTQISKHKQCKLTHASGFPHTCTLNCIFTNRRIYTHTCRITHIYTHLPPGQVHIHTAIIPEDGNMKWTRANRSKMCHTVYFLSNSIRRRKRERRGGDNLVMHGRMYVHTRIHKQTRMLTD